MDRLKFRCVTDAGIFHAPSDSFSVSFHDTGISLIFWSSDGIVDEIDVKSVDRFTGQVDRSGREIYENDILRFKWIKTEYIGLVNFRNGSFALKNESVNVLTHLISLYTNCSELLGNIHENPELIEV